jgi:hypothetical protein
VAAFSLFDLVLGAHDYVGTVTYGASSSGTTATLNDRTFSSAHADNQFQGGTIFFVQSTNTSIEQQYRRITAYNASSGQYTFTTLSSAVTTATQYAVATPEFDVVLMERLANDALRSLGPLVYSARAITSSANQKVYTISTALAVGGAGSFGKYSRPFRIDIQGRTGSSADNPDWVELYGWYLEPTTAGAGVNVVFPRYLPAGRDVRVWYEDHHAYTSASTARIDERLHPELCVLALVDKLYQYRNSRSRGAQEFDIQRWNDAKRQLAEARVRWPIWRPKRKPDILVVGGEDAGGSFTPPWGGIE